MRTVAVLLSVALAACQGSSPPSPPSTPSSPSDSPVLARTPSGDFTEAELREILARLPQNSTAPEAREVFDRAVEIELLAAEAKRRGYDQRVDIEWQVKKLLATTMMKDEAERIRGESGESAREQIKTEKAALIARLRSDVVIDETAVARALSDPTLVSQAPVR
jgi:hypothetical protein